MKVSTLIVYIATFLLIHWVHPIDGANVIAVSLVLAVSMGVTNLIGWFDGADTLRRIPRSTM